ncbi:GL22754 [Drosophila persimilis]|uniref:GL22754 n=1 Tax=Drosophila persimilis TaxID=7234 RepID=B4GZQ1_DROPE|nr:GL22754 [Drosophila persimilis]
MKRRIEPGLAQVDLNRHDPVRNQQEPESEESDLEMLSCHDTSRRSRSPSLLKM